MTWVLGWPFYNDDAIKMAKKLNLVKDPNAEEVKYIDAARTWVTDRASYLEGFCCWVGTMPELVFAAYIEYGDSPTPPTDAELDRDYLMSKKQYRRLKSLMPLRDFAWYQHDDPSCTLYKTIEWVYDDDDDDEGEEADEGKDETECEGGTETDEEVVEDDGASDWEDEDDGDSDVETVRAGARKRSSA